MVYLYCLYFSAWIESTNIKPYEGPWKDQLSKLNKVTFRQAMEDIKRHMDDPTEIDGIICKSTGIRSHPTEADFDKIRAGLTEDEEENTTDANANNLENNGETSTLEDDDLTPSAVGKTPKRTPKSKSAMGTASSKASKTSTTKSAAKRRSSQSVSASKRKRHDVSAHIVDHHHLHMDYEDSAPPLRRKINTDALAHIGSHSSTPRRNHNSIALLERPHVKVPEAQAIDMSTRSQTLAERDIEPSDLTFGFLGLGIMGSTIVKDLICTGHKVVVWNRTMSKCDPFQEAGAIVKGTPSDVVEAADIIFCCVSDPKASKDVIYFVYFLKLL